MRLLERVLTMAIFILFVLMIVAVTIQIVNRYGTQFSIPWTEELARTAYILLIFIGSALATLRGKHVTVRSGLQLLKPLFRRRVEILAALASAVFFAFVSYGNYIYAGVNWDSTFPTMSWLSIGAVTAVVLAASGLTAVLFVYRAFTPVKDHEEVEDAT